MKVRLANPSDRDSFLALVEAKRYPSSPVTEVTGPQRGQDQLHQYSTKWNEYSRRNDFKILLAERGRSPAAFLVLGLNQKSGLTGEMQSRVMDHGGVVQAYPAMVEAALALSRMQGNKYLTTRVYASDNDEKVLFEGLGFKPELARVVKRAALEDYRGSCSLRLADASDLMYIALLNAKSIRYYLYANRVDNPEVVAARNFAHYLNLDLSNQEKLLGLIAEDEIGPVGYVLLQNYWEMDVSLAPGSYVYDVAVDPRLRGSRSGLQLARYGHSQIHRLHREFSFGDVSFANPRTLKWACLALGYRVDWERWGMPIGTWVSSQEKSR